MKASQFTDLIERDIFELIDGYFIGWGTAEYTPLDIKTSVTLREETESGG